MLRLSRIIKNFQESGALNENMGVFGFLDGHAFLTKAGDIGLVLRVVGVDFECMDSREMDYLTKRLEAAFRLFDLRFRVYPSLLKTNAPPLPHTEYPDD